MSRRNMDQNYRHRRVDKQPNLANQRPRQQRGQVPKKPQNPGRRKPSPGLRNERRRQSRRHQARRGVLLVVGLIVLLATIYGASKAYVALQKWQGKAEKSDFVVTAAKPIEKEEEIVNLAIFGTDEDGFRTDVNMVASFNTTTKALHLIAVPRDTRVTMTKDMTAYLQKEGRTVPERNGVYGQCKLNEVHAYAGEGNRSAFSVAMLEEILGIQMDYYIKVDLSSFRDIVDAVGGVDIEVQDRLYYVDPYQDLYIDLYPGFQHLDGAKAEQLVRFREDYAQKDLKRIQVQQDFMRAFLEKVCSTESILKNMTSLVNIGLRDTESNITVTEAMKYVKYLSDIDPAAMTTVTVPGEGGSYFDMDVAGTEALIQELIYGIKPVNTEQDSTMTTSLTE